MKIVGLTGGIGSGKTTVAKMFSEFGVPVYIADIESKKLTNTSKLIRKKLTALLGKEAYINNELNRVYIANLIFSDEDLLQKTNLIIHPEVAKHFKNWLKKQEGLYCIKEVAILFENGGYKECDVTLLITAPFEEKIRRIIKRDSTTQEKIKERMSNQWSDTKKSKLANFVIENIDLELTKQKVENIHKHFLEVFNC